MKELEQLKDIKPIEIISIDFTFYFIAVTLFIIFISILLYFLTKSKKKKLTKAQKAKQYLKSMDFKKMEDKDIAYTFTIYGYDCVQEQYKDEFLRIVSQLEQYKYKKIVEKIDDDIVSQIEDYIKVRV